MSDHAEDPYADAGDVTSRRLAQTVDALAEVQTELDDERLRREQSEALLDRLFGSLSDAVLVIDPRGVISRANQAAAALFGRPPGELEGMSARDLYRDDVPCTPWELFEASSEGHLSQETVVVNAQGDGREVSLSCGIVRDPDGRLHGAIHAARDLSEVHGLLREVATAEERWRVLAHVGRWFTEALEPDEILDGVVAGLEEDSGLGVALVLSDAGVVSGVHVSPGVPDDGAGLIAIEGTVPPRGSALASAINDGRTIHAPTVDNGFPLLGRPSDAIGSAAVMALRTNTETMGAMVVVSPEQARIDDPTFTLMEEVANRVALNLANARLRERLVEHRATEEATRYRDEILAAVSHDMKTPLAVLLGFVDMLEDHDHDPAELEKVHGSIGRQVRRLRRLTTQFLDYVRTEAGHELSLTPRPVDLQRVVEAVASSLPHSGRIEVDLSDPLPPVLADESRLDRALANLVSNALKYAPGDTPVTITAQVVGPHVEVSVTDRGPGIPPDEQAHLFDKFVRGPGDTGVEGSGLGLYMTRRIMRSQGGEVRVASRSGQGSRFTLILRRADVADEPDAADEPDLEVVR